MLMAHKAQLHFRQTVRARLRDIAIRNGVFLTGGEWSIGVAALDSLEDIPELVNAPSVLTAAGTGRASARFVADPFLFEQGSTVYMFMEVLDGYSDRGVIGLAELNDHSWTFSGIALAESFHLSYPQVLQSDGQFYMIPETMDERCVKLYRAAAFPYEWEYCCTLLDGAPYSDASLFEHAGQWWMFVESSLGPDFDTLRLFSSQHLKGPWTEHPCSPVIEGNAQASRPAGPPIVSEGRIIRLAQDCSEVYGAAVFGFEVLRLDSRGYEERPLGPEPLLAGTGAGWNGQAMHHISLIRRNGGWLAAVDGRPKPGFRFFRWQRRRRESSPVTEDQRQQLS